MSNKPKFGIITKQLNVGTRIYWDSKNGCLYFVDVPTSISYKFVPQSKALLAAPIGDEPLAFSFPVSDKENLFIGGLGRKFITFECNFEDGSISNVKVISEIDTEDGFRENRLNGAKIDPFGTLWAGTMGPEINGQVVPGKGSLYSVKRGVVKKHEANIGISNGLAWNQKKDKMFYADTLCPDVFVYNYEPDGPNISNKKCIFNVQTNNIPGQPDGLCMDDKDNLWIAMIFGSCILQINSSTGSLLRNIIMPVSQPTAMTFGGQQLNTLYATTAKIPVNGKAPDYPAGCTYAIDDLDASGVPDTPYKL